jgi:protoporphyrin/coproporphyrin ferrochelatase
VRKYLAEFLMDPCVVDIPFLARLALVYGIILPTRPKKSAKAYKKVWTDRGSPLLFHLVDLKAKVAEALKKDFQVEAAMRYGKPTIESALEKFKSTSTARIQVLPLYPQHSLAATVSSVEKTQEAAKRIGLQAKLDFMPAFFDEEGFVDAFTETTRNALAGFNHDYVLFSFHGLPERQIKKVEHGNGNYCLANSGCCETIREENRDCYRAQSFATAHAIAQKLGLGKSDFNTKYSVSFQSRLGRTPWIKPYTDLVFEELVKKGVKRLAVACPSFVADCLETLEEIEIRGRESFIAFGGQDLKLVPSLNSSDVWVRAVADMAKKTATETARAT